MISIRRIAIAAITGATIIGTVLSLNMTPGYTALCAGLGAVLGAVSLSRKNREEDVGGYYGDDDAGDDD